MISSFKKFLFSSSFSLVLTSTLALALFTSCEQETINEPSTSSDMKEPQLVDWTINFSDFEITDMPLKAKIAKAAVKTATEAGVRRINFAIYDSNGNLVKDTVQNKDIDPTNFGKAITLRIPVGTYKFVAVAHNVRNDDDASVIINKVSEASLGKQMKLDPTYSVVKEVTVSGNTTQNDTIDFGTRRNAKLLVKITDATPSDVQKMELIVSPTASDYTDLKFDPATGFAPSTWRYSSVIDKTESSVTTFTNKKLTLGFLLTGATQMADIIINALAADNTVLYTRTIGNVTFQQSQQKNAIGTFFSPKESSSFDFDMTLDKDTISLD